MFGLIARRPELLKRVASMFAYFLGGEGGLIEPQLLELMRLRGAHLNACTYCATVRLQPVADAVRPKEAFLGVRDISGMTKAQAVAALKGALKADKLSPREAAAIALVDRIIVDPHSVDDKLLTELRRHFRDDEIIELICASSLFTWAGTLNTALHVETGKDSVYGGDLAYATAGVDDRPPSEERVVPLRDGGQEATLH
jgi:alkylhydroperoxidase family enzyme